MKKLGLAVVLMLSFVLTSRAQTSIPFNGFELSNYEVGDTLEYYVIKQSPMTEPPYTFVYGGRLLWIVTDKATTPDSIHYTVKQISSINNSSGTTVVVKHITMNGVFTDQSPPLATINNFIGVSLFLDPTWMSYTFDTINGLKHFQLFGSSLNYELHENLGVINFYHEVGSYSDDYELVYARLQHYGVYGTYEPVYLTNEENLTQKALAVNYNEDNKTLRFITNQSLNGSLKLYDALGRCVMSSRLNENFVRLDNLANGMYFYSVTGTQAASGKILIR